MRAQPDWIAHRDLMAAITVGDAIHAAVERLGRYPEVGRTGRVPTTRELVVTGTPYVVVYRVDATAVLILRVLHGAQQWPPS